MSLWSVILLRLKIFTGCFAKVMGCFAKVTGCFAKIWRSKDFGYLSNSTPARVKISRFLACFYGFTALMPFVWAEAEKAPPAKPHFIEQMMPFIFIFILFYFLLIRPAQKRQKKHQNLVNQLKKGDSVITSSGILGIIYGLTDSFVTLEVADNVRIRVLRSQISSLVEPDTGKK